MKCLVTGGAGFIGSHTVDRLLAEGHEVRILDNLSKPVHLKGRPTYLAPDAEFIEGDVRDKDLMRSALNGADVVYHFAAYQDYLPDFSTYFAVNATATALIYELIVEDKLPIQKVIVASSQAVAGEGCYKAQDGSVFTPDIRPADQLARGEWEIVGPDGVVAEWTPTPEDVSNPQNQYGMSKLSEEMIALQLGKRYGIPSVAMRYSIVQGPRQSFYNAYSGACRIFCLSLYFDKAPVLYEDGQQIRDFVNIHDVVDANILVLKDSRADYRAFNVGGGEAYTVEQFAGICRDVFDRPEIELEVPGAYRYGDTRHIFSDIAAIQSLGWEPKRSARESVTEYVAYLNKQTDIDDILDYAQKKMKALNVVRAVGS
ncbi:MAG: NAD-dependent epimerase/dehydratase family protein [Kiritimatiellae bacterium]|nr:NAD-dependent epimerase/dehydratase family protein [Kiritimatiellia bacterium]